MIRRLFTIASAASLLGCCLLGVLWLVTTFRHDAWVTEKLEVAGPYSRAEWTEVHSARGRVWARTYREALVPQPAHEVLDPWSALESGELGRDLAWSDASPPGTRWVRAEMDADRLPRTRSTARAYGVYTTRTLLWVEYSRYVPWLAVLPFVWGVRRLRDVLAARENPRPGVCAACGYDLRATPERCPECGAVPVGG